MKKENQKGASVSPASGHPKVPHDKTGVLLINLGTPSALDYFSMRRYLKQFLSDPRVVESNRFVWWCVLNLILLNFIPQRSAKNYAKIWDNEKNESPLLTITKAQTEKLREIFKSVDTRLRGHDEVIVEYAMRYGEPSIYSQIRKLQEQGCDALLAVPLYPQYSAVTTGSVCDDVFDALGKMRHMPALRVLKPYYDAPEYIEALAESVKQSGFKAGKNSKLLCSFHGIPTRYFKNGDPYPCHCMKTVRLLREKLGLKEEDVLLTYQSKFGREEWLTPNTEDVLKELPSKGVTDVTILTPGFAADCVETLEEIAMGGKETFLEAGGKNFTFVPCLNDSEAGMKMLENLVQKELKTTTHKKTAA